jgi:hypothetical protein
MHGFLSSKGEATACSLGHVDVFGHVVLFAFVLQYSRGYDRTLDIHTLYKSLVKINADISTSMIPSALPLSPTVFAMVLWPWSTPL